MTRCVKRSSKQRIGELADQPARPLLGTPRQACSGAFSTRHARTQRCGQLSAASRPSAHRQMSMPKPVGPNMAAATPSARREPNPAP
jgi:hypothetical protein